MPIAEAQDESEPFDLYDESGAPLGCTKARALVHRDGDWHRSVHVWVVLAPPDGERLVVFQKRSAAKDTWPGALDVAVGGHLRAGESVEDALREAEEELGLELRPADVVRLGLRKRDDRHAPGVRDRELQEVLLAVTPRSLDELRPSPAEVEAVAALPLATARLLFDRAVERAAAHVLAALDGPPPALSAATITAADFVEAPDGYWSRALASIERRLAGEPEAPWTLP